MILVVCPNPSVDSYVFLKRIKPGKVNRVEKEIFYPGGKGVHVAIGLQELGEKTTLLGFWAGPTGKWLQVELEKLGVSWRGPEVKGWSRICQTFKTEDEFDESEMLGVGPALFDEDYALFIKSYKSLLPEISLVVMSGSWPKGAPENGYKELVELAHELAIPVVVDATGVQMKNALKAHPDLIHLNFEEAKEITGKQTIDEILKDLKKQTGSVALTDGKEGLYLLQKDRIIHGKVLLDRIISAVGSGDSLTAGLAYGLKNGYSQEELTKLGVACGAANCLRRELGLFYKKDVEDLLKKVTVNTLSI